MICKIFIFSFLITILATAYQDYTFKELLELQNSNKNAFDSVMLKEKFSLTDIQEDKNLQSIKYIFKPDVRDSLTNLFKVERTESKVYFGRKQSMLLLVAISIFTYNPRYYDQLIKECKTEGFYFRDSTNLDLEYSNFKTNEFRKAAEVAQFATGKLDGKDIYRISISHSPK